MLPLIKATLKALKKRKRKNSFLLLLSLLGGCYTPVKVTAPIYLCYISTKADVCVPVKDPKKLTVEDIFGGKLTSERR